MHPLVSAIEFLAQLPHHPTREIDASVEVPCLDERNRDTSRPDASFQYLCAPAQFEGCNDCVTETLRHTRRIAAGGIVIIDCSIK
jgi:hypothetical protein